VAEAVDVEGVVVAQELEQVEAGQVARRVVEVHVLGARVRPVDAAGVGGRVPVVDRAVELHAGVGALPGRPADLAEQLAGLDRAHHVAGRDLAQAPVAVVDDRPHELVGHPDRVVGVLVLERVAVPAVEVHVEAGLLEHPGLALLERLAPDELLDVRVAGVEDDHLGGPARLAARLDGAGRGVGTPHEADRARGRAAALEQLDRAADAGEVDAGAGAALEDDALLPVPVEDRVHGIVDREDEAGAGLLGHARDADVEPHRAVERGLLGDEQVLELGVERVGLGVVGEVATLGAPAGDLVGHPVDDLAQRPLALGRAQGAAEVLLGHDVGGIERPGGREFDPDLLEGDGPVPEVGDARVAPVPVDHLVGMHALGRVMATDSDARLLGSESHGASRFSGRVRGGERAASCDGPNH
jgi:hypothetical protein